MLSPFVRQRLTTLVSKEHHTHIERLAEYRESGDVTPAVGRRYPLERAGDAMRDLGAGATRGKSVISVIA